MRSITIIILHAFIAQGVAKELVDQTQKSADTAVDKLSGELVNKLIDRLRGVASLQDENVDDTTLAKTHSDKSIGLPHIKGPVSPSKVSLASLPGPSSLKNQVANRIKEVNGRCYARPVSVHAEDTAVATTGDDDKFYMRLMKNPEKMAPLTKDKVKEMAGVTAPLGVFDPLGISTSVPEGQLLFYRAAELKHGRVCMLAILGLVVGDRHDFFPILGQGIDPSVPAWKFATPFVNETPLQQFWPAILTALFFEELRSEAYFRDNPDKAPGDYGWDPLGLKPKDAKGFKELQNKELNNGRLAMFAAAGWIAQEELTGSKLWPFVN